MLKSRYLRLSTLPAHFPILTAIDSFNVDEQRLLQNVAFLPNLQALRLQLNLRDLSPPIVQESLATRRHLKRLDTVLDSSMHRGTSTQDLCDHLTSLCAENIDSVALSIIVQASDIVGKVFEALRLLLNRRNRVKLLPIRLQGPPEILHRRKCTFYHLLSIIL